MYDLICVKRGCTHPGACMRRSEENVKYLPLSGSTVDFLLNLEITFLVKFPGSSTWQGWGHRHTCYTGLLCRCWGFELMSSCFQKSALTYWAIFLDPFLHCALLIWKFKMVGAFMIFNLLFTSHKYGYFARMYICTPWVPVVLVGQMRATDSNLWKSSMCSYLMSHFSSPTFMTFKRKANNSGLF